MSPDMPMRRFKPAMKSSEWLQSGSTAALRKSQNIRERTFFINFSILAAPGAGRSGRARTCDPRFWRPVLYQLSYTPAEDPASPPIRAVSSIGDAPFARAKRSNAPDRSAGNALFKPSVLRQTSRQTTKAKRRAHDRANRRKTRRRAADTATPSGKTGIAGALVHPIAADVGCVQARHRQGNHTGRDRDGRAPRPDRLVRCAGQAKPGVVNADGAQLHLPHLLNDKTDRLRGHHDVARGRPLPAQRPDRKIHSGI